MLTLSKFLNSSVQVNRCLIPVLNCSTRRSNAQPPFVRLTGGSSLTLHPLTRRRGNSGEETAREIAAVHVLSCRLETLEGETIYGPVHTET